MKLSEHEIEAVKAIVKLWTPRMARVELSASNIPVNSPNIDDQILFSDLLRILLEDTRNFLQDLKKAIGSERQIFLGKGSILVDGMEFDYETELGQ